MNQSLTLSLSWKIPKDFNLHNYEADLRVPFGNH
jgi:hypothetical protein